MTAAAAGGGAALRRDRAADPVARRPIQLDSRPEPLDAPRGIALAMAMGALMWAAAIAVVLIF